MTRSFPGYPQYRLTAASEGGQAVLAVSGELDMATAEEFAVTVREQLAAGPLLLDLRDLSFMDSSVLRALDGLLREVEREGWSLAIQSDLHPNVRRLLEMTGMLATLPLQDGPARSAVRHADLPPP